MGQIILTTAGGGTATEGFCTRCDYPYYGKRCEKFRTARQADVVIVVTKPLYGHIRGDLDQYQKDLKYFESKSSDVMVWDMPRAPQLRPYRTLRHELKKDWVFRKTKYAFLIGDLPVPWGWSGQALWRNMSYHRKVDPFLSYYGTFSGSQEFPDDRCDGKFERIGAKVTSGPYPTLTAGVTQRTNAGKHTGWKQTVDLAIGVINHVTPTEAHAYFKRLHKYRSGGMTLGSPKKTWLFNEGDWVCRDAPPLRNASIKIVGTPPRIQWVDALFGTPLDCLDFKWHRKEHGKEGYADRKKLAAPKYRAVMQDSRQRATYYWGASHAWAGGLSRPMPEIAEMRNQPFQGMSFFNQFHCSSSRFTELNIGVTLAVLTKYGLASVGVTHTGAMLWPKDFEKHLERGKPWAEAGRLWFNEVGWKYDKWHHGHVFYGDPAVRLRGPPRLSGAMSVMSSSEEVGQDQTFRMEDVGPDTNWLDETMVEDEEMLLEHDQEDLSFDAFERAETLLDAEAGSMSITESKEGHPEVLALLHLQNE